ncbi:MAG: hypothetical protein J5684_07210 [Eubacterium sp.]|nr:hypothetical protein [Eubacterium sp.]
MTKKKATKTLALLLTSLISVGTFSTNSPVYAQHAEYDNESQIPDNTSEQMPEQQTEQSSEQTPEQIPEHTEDRIHYITLNGDPTQSSDSILVESNGHFGLIDASNKTGDTQYGIKIHDSASGKAVVNYLMAAGVTHLDFILVTHSHSDHNGGIPDVAKAKRSEKVTTTVTETEYISTNTIFHKPVTKTETNKFGLIDKDTTFIYKGYISNPDEELLFNNEKYFNTAKKVVKGANMLRVDKPTSRALKKLGGNSQKNGSGDLDDTISFRFEDFNIQLYNLHTRSHNDENANSIVTYIEKSGIKTALMADLDVYKKTEQQIAKYIKKDHGKIDVLKVGHHGFVRSTSKELLETLKPQIAVVVTSTASLDDSTPFYGFLDKKGKKMYRTIDQTASSIVQDMTDTLTMRTGVRKKANVVLKKETTETTEESKVVTNGITGRKVTKTSVEKKVTSNHTISYSRTPIRWVQKQKNSTWSRWYSDYNKFKWVFVDKQGRNRTGWNKIKGYWFEFDKNGLMKTGWSSKKGKKVYLLKESYNKYPMGSMIKGWYKINGSYYYFESSGAAKTGWVQYQSNWCYCTKGKAFNKGWKKIENKYYYFGEDYYMKTGWLQEGETWYYLDQSGVMVTGDQVIDGISYHFTDDGHWVP